ncbi:MAG: hypothetical protein ACFFCM_11660 [Promethearchaeota archaeon]
MFQNLTTGVIIATISAIIFLILAIPKLREYIDTKFPQDILIVCVWLLFFIFSLLQALAYLFLSEELFRFSYIIISCNAILLLVFIDYITNESINTIRFTFMIGLFVGTMISIFFPNSSYKAFYPNGNLGIFIGGYFRILFSITFGIMILIFIYYSSKIYIKAPHKLKIPSAFFLLGVITFSIVPLIVTLLNITSIIPAFHLLWMGIGAIIIGIAYIKEPKIAYILPFKVIKLAVVEIKRGISLFTYDWTKKEELSEQATFSAMIHAVGKFIEENLKWGGIREIFLDKANLILKKNEKYPIICVLVSNKTSRSLRNALYCFTNRFVKEYSQYFSNPTDIDKYKAASEIISGCFSFVPEY